MPPRPLPLLVIAILLPHGVRAQASIASDLWRVAAGTLAVPASLSEGGMAPVWTPAVALGEGERARLGIEAIHTPPELAVTGGLIAFTTRVRGLGTVSLTYGRISVGDVAYTETSPEALGDVAIYNQSVSAGLSGRIGRGVIGGLALRYLSGVLGFASRQQFGLDAGAIYTTPHLRLGAATRFFDPHFGASEGAASYNAGAEYRSTPFDAWGTRALLLARYGITAQRGEAAQHLLGAGLALGTSFALDAGAAHESTDGSAVWRSRLAFAVGSGAFHFQIGRDGGVNGFGATYRLALTAAFR